MSTRRIFDVAIKQFYEIIGDPFENLKMNNVIKCIQDNSMNNIGNQILIIFILFVINYYYFIFLIIHISTFLAHI